MVFLLTIWFNDYDMLCDGERNILYEETQVIGVFDSFNEAKEIAETYPIQSNSCHDVRFTIIAYKVGECGYLGPTYERLNGERWRMYYLGGHNRENHSFDGSISDAKEFVMRNPSFG